MNRTKQNHTNAADDERGRFSGTYFEDLSNEIFYEIFDFLDMHHIYEAFSDLNIRFDNLLHGSTLPLNINMSFLSKSNFQRYYKQFVLPNINRINSLHLWNPFIIDLVFPSLENIQKFIELKILILDNIISTDLLDCLISLSNLSSLIINQPDYKSFADINYHSIIRLPALKYCKISCEACVLFDSPFNTNNQSSPVEHLIINSKVDVDELPHLLSCVPHLRRLSIDCLYRNYDSRSRAFSKVSDKLTHVSLKLERIDFDQCEPLIINLFRSLQVLRISLSNDIAYLDAKRWEQLILSHMTRLRVFDIRYVHKARNDSDWVIHNALIKQFTSSFWVERLWFFAHQYQSVNRFNDGMFYSIKPYRRRDYILHNMDNQQLYPTPIENNFHFVRHVHIQNQSTMDSFSIYFPNANELTISGNVINRHSIISIFDHILPLNQLHQIIIDDDYFDFATIVEMLHFTPNCYKLILNSIELDEEKLVSVQSDATFSLVSNINKMSNVTIKSTCTLNKVKLWTKLCPRLQHLAIKVLHEDFTSTIKFLVSQSHKNTHQLFSLSIQSTEEISIEKVTNLLQSLGCSDKFSVRETGYYDCYIWW